MKNFEDNVNIIDEDIDELLKDTNFQKELGIELKYYVAEDADGCRDLTNFGWKTLVYNNKEYKATKKVKSYQISVNIGLNQTIFTKTNQTDELSIVSSKFSTDVIDELLDYLFHKFDIRIERKQTDLKYIKLDRIQETDRNGKPVYKFKIDNHEIYIECNRYYKPWEGVDGQVYIDNLFKFDLNEMEAFLWILHDILKQNT